MEKHYIKTLFLVLILLVGGFSVFNYVVNPLGIYGTPHIEGLHDRFPAASAYSRIYKSERVKMVKPEVVVIGSSRADIGLNPKSEYFGGKRVYNFGLSAATVREQYANFAFAQAVHPLDEAIITLDFFAYNALKLDNKQFEPDRLSQESLRGLKPFSYRFGTIPSVDMFAVSLKHLRYLKKPDKYSYARANGHKVHLNGRWNIKHKGVEHVFKRAPNTSDTSIDTYSFEFSNKPGDTTFSYVHKIIDLAEKHNTKLYFLFSPVFDLRLQVYKADHLDDEFVYWKDTIAGMISKTPYELWDFTVENGILRDKYWFWDTNHYKEELGDIILHKVLGLYRDGEDPYPDFGVKLVSR